MLRYYYMYTYILIRTHGTCKLSNARAFAFVTYVNVWTWAETQVGVLSE